MLIISWLVLQLKKYWKQIIYAAAFLIGVTFLILAMKSCFTPTPPKLNEQEIQKAQDAVKTGNDAQLTEILAASDAREAAIDANVNDAKQITINVTAESRKKWANASFEEKVAEYNRRKAEVR